MSEKYDADTLANSQTELDLLKASVTTFTEANDALELRSTAIEAKQVQSDWFYTNPSRMSI